jgi:hypothetical protein
MADELPVLIGAPLDVAVAERVRDKLLKTAEEASRNILNQVERSPSDQWPELMRQSFALDAIAVKLDATWWVARRSKSLAAIVRDELRADR